MHITVFRTVFAQYCSLPILKKDALLAMLPGVEINEISLHEGD